MIVNQRFFINEDRYIIDRVNWANNALVQVPVGCPEDWQNLRQDVFRTRLRLLLRALIGLSPVKKGDSDKHARWFNKTDWTLSVVLGAIGSANATGRDIELRHHEKFDEDPNRDQRGVQDFTSLSLFVDDVERLLRDLYGEFDNDVTEHLRQAIFEIMGTTTKRMFRDLWDEHSNAWAVDYGWAGIGVAPGDGISTGNFFQANRAAEEIARRARAVRSNPSKFSKYTVQFVKALDDRWPDFEKNKSGLKRNRHKRSGKSI